MDPMIGHQQIVQEARDAINKVFEDPEVSKEQTIASLNTLAYEIAILLTAVSESTDEAIGESKVDSKED